MSETIQFRRWLSWVVLALVLLGVALFFADERNLHTVTSDRGWIESGEKYGVAVGASIPEATDALERRGFRREYLHERYQVRATSCGDYDLREGDETHVFNDRSWREGGVCLIERDGAVAVIAWVWSFCPICV